MGFFRWFFLVFWMGFLSPTLGVGGGGGWRRPVQVRPLGQRGGGGRRRGQERKGREGGGQGGEEEEVKVPVQFEVILLIDWLIVWNRYHRCFCNTKEAKYIQWYCLTCWNSLTIDGLHKQENKLAFVGFSFLDSWHFGTDPNANPDPRMLIFD